LPTASRLAASGPAAEKRPVRNFSVRKLYYKVKTVQKEAMAGEPEPLEQPLQALTSIHAAVESHGSFGGEPSCSVKRSQGTVATSSEQRAARGVLSAAIRNETI
jgi:hypothetical protein